MSFIWRNYIPKSAPYPQLLHTGKDVSKEVMLELYFNATSGAPYEAASVTPLYKSKDEMIKEAFEKLTKAEKIKWMAIYGKDFEMFDYPVPSYLKI